MRIDFRSKLIGKNFYSADPDFSVISSWFSYLIKWVILCFVIEGRETEFSNYFLPLVAINYDSLWLIFFCGSEGPRKFKVDFSIHLLINRAIEIPLHLHQNQSKTINNFSIESSPIILIQLTSYNNILTDIHK